MLIRLVAGAAIVILAACGSGAASDSSGDSKSPGKPAANTSDAVAPSAVFPYVNVKSWSGTVTAEATDASAFGDVKSVATYTATGDVTLVDDSTPNPPHAVWPQPSAADLTDPKKAENAYKVWRAHVTYKLHKTGVGVSGDKVDETCTGEGDEPGLVQIMMMPSQYSLSVEPPVLRNVQCTGTSVLPVSGAFLLSRVKIDGNVGGPKDPISGTSNQSMGDVKGSITYKLTPKN